MRSAILIVALFFGVDFGADAAATAARQERYHAEYADALEEMERDIGVEVVHESASEESSDGVGGVGVSARANGRPRRANVMDGEEVEGYRKKVDRRRAERERRALDHIQELDGKGSRRKGDPQDNEEGRDLRQEFHQRQKKKRAQIDEMHRKVSEAIEAHREGRRLLDDEELEDHERRRRSLEKKRRSMEEESPERYVERMDRHEERMLEKMERKRRRRDERARSSSEEL